MPLGRMFVASWKASSVTRFILEEGMMSSVPGSGVARDWASSVLRAGRQTCNRLRWTLALSRGRAQCCVCTPISAQLCRMHVGIRSTANGSTESRAG